MHSQFCVCCATILRFWGSALPPPPARGKNSPKIPVLAEIRPVSRAYPSGFCCAAPKQEPRGIGGPGALSFPSARPTAGRKPAKIHGFLQVFSACQKASQSLRPQAQISCKSVFSGGVYVGNHTLRAASVEFSRPTPRKLRARQTAVFC